MPFELGIDYGISIGGDDLLASKCFLIIAEDRYTPTRALSDIAGWDLGSHDGMYERAVEQVRTWLRSHGLADRPVSKILGDYTGFQEWDYERLLAKGWTEADIQRRATGELLEAMCEWRDADRPATFS
jgi:hypothetical protein